MLKVLASPLKLWLSQNRQTHLVHWLRQGLHFAENLKYRCWEWIHFYTTRLPSDGEMIAILRRMGMSSFAEYIAWHMLGRAEQTSFINPTAAIQAFKTQHPEEIPLLLNAANALIKGDFEILGSDQVSMKRHFFSPGYAIDWCRDPITGDRYRRRFDARRWHHSNVKSGKPDVKGPWEIGRMQHFALLGQAYRLSNDPRYAACFADTVTDFIKRNPVGSGVQWACPMDVSLRVVSWIIGISFFEKAPQLTRTWWKRFLKSLVEHGRFIAANLEFGTLNGTIVTSNHYLTNLFGLYWLALAFPGLDVCCVWRGIAERGLEHDMFYQTHPDGGDFESSIPYHGLVMEMLLSAYALSVHHKLPLSDAYRQRLLLGMRLIKALRQNNGRQPQVGDADNGRAHIFTHYYASNPDNLDSLLAAAAHVLDCPELAHGLPKTALQEALFWGSKPTEPLSLPALSNPSVFPCSGLGVMRANDIYVLLSNTPKGTRGFSNHKHNDHLAIEWVVGDQPLLVDAGSYTYTRDPTARNLFRQTATHNTVMIDHQEQNRFNPEGLFRMDNDAEIDIAGFSTAEGKGLCGAHTGYQRLDDPVTHTRTVLLNNEGMITLEDNFISKKSHHFRWHFLLYPDVRPTLTPSGIVLDAPLCQGFITCQTALNWQIEEAWYSKGYGHRQKTYALVAELTAQLAQVIFVLKHRPLMNQLTDLP